MVRNLALGEKKVNSRRRIYIISVLLSNLKMDIDEIRRTNIRLLEAIAGSPRSAADRVQMTYAQYVNLRDGAKDARSRKPRAMRKETAWRFEDAFGKDRGWLDTDHSAPEGKQVAEPVAHYQAHRRHSRPWCRPCATLPSR